MANVADTSAPQVSIEDLAKEEDTLVQLIESYLFMRGESVAAADIAETLGIPREAIDHGLQQLARRYECFHGAIRVRQLDDEYWIMDLKDDVSEQVDTFYIEQKPYTKSDIMTIAFIAYTQPVPKQVLAFYRGNNGTAQARKWIDAGFMLETKVSRDDPGVANLIQKCIEERDAAAPADESSEQDETSGKKRHHNRDGWLDKEEFSCYVTAPRFAGYFNLPRDVTEMKAELDDWKEIYGLLD